MNQKVRIIVASVISLLTIRVCTATVPLAVYGVSTIVCVRGEAEATATRPYFEIAEQLCGALVLQTLIVTIIMQAHRVWFTYNPIVNEICTDAKKLVAGELTALVFCALGASALFLALQHRHFAAELMVGIGECGMLVLLLIALRNGDSRSHKIPSALASEAMHIFILVWIMIVTSQGPLKSSSAFGTLALVTAVLVLNAHYVLHVVVQHIQLARNIDSD